MDISWDNNGIIILSMGYLSGIFMGYLCGYKNAKNHPFGRVHTSYKGSLKGRRNSRVVYEHGGFTLSVQFLAMY